jgi:hypothetical protein
MPVLTDVELVPQVSDANAGKLGTNEAEDPVGRDCGRCASDMMWSAVVVGIFFGRRGSYLVRMDRELISA